MALVQQTADGGAPEKAAALARGLGLGMGPDAPDSAAAPVDLPALVLAALEARGLDGGVRELVVGDGALQLATLRRMLVQSRGLAHAAHFLPALQHSRVKVLLPALAAWCPTMPPLAVPQLAPRAFSGRAWRLRAARHTQGEAQPLGRPATASGARASRLQSCRLRLLLTIQSLARPWHALFRGGAGS